MGIDVGSPLPDLDTTARAKKRGKAVVAGRGICKSSLSRQKTIPSPRREGTSMTVLGWHHVTVDPTGYSPDLHHWGSCSIRSGGGK
ncbi:hypothetical protein PSTT_14452, partial [Puccinia striiformis]